MLWKMPLLMSGTKNVVIPRGERGASPLGMTIFCYLSLNNISYSKDLQSQSSQSLPPANPSPKEEMQPTRNEKSLSIISICWHMTVPWHFNFCNKQNLKRQLNIFCVQQFWQETRREGEIPRDILEGSDF